jgi:lysophospholipase L1-like esterase
MAGRLKGSLKKLGFTAFTLLLLFALLDTGYRVFRALTRRPGQEALFELDPELGRRHVKGASVVVVEWSKPGANRVTINALGFRGPTPRTLEKPPGVIRVVAQGGSTTEDIFVDDGRTWPEQLQAKLNTRLKTDRIEVINMGTSGYTAENCVKDLKLNGLRLKPDVVIAYHGVNDFRKAMRSLNDFEEVEAYVKYEERRTNWLTRLLCKSSIIDAISRERYYRGGARSRAFTLAYWNAPDKVDTNLAGIEAPVVKALEELLELSRRHHFKLVIGRQATLMKPRLSDEEVTRMWRVFRWKCRGQYVKWESFLEARNRVVDAQARFAAKHGLPYIDTEAAVPKTVEFFVDDAHTFGNGADRISACFAEGLVKAGVFDDLLESGKDAGPGEPTRPGR